MTLAMHWGLAIAYLGVVIGLGAQFHMLPAELRGRYAAWFTVTVILIGVGTFLQMSGAE